MKKILSILLLISLLTIAFTACDITPSIENEESTPQSSTESSSNNSDDVNDKNNNNNTNNDSNNNSNNDNSTNNSDNNNGENNTPPSTTLTEEEKYNNALSLLSKGKNEEAFELLNEIKTYAPAQEKLKNFFYAPQTVNEKWKYSDDTDYRTDSIVYTYNSMGNIIETSDNQLFIYNADGNILSGCDLTFGTYYTYTYKGEKLYQKKSSSETYTYYYNSDGTISKEIEETNYGTTEFLYQYTDGKLRYKSYGTSYMKYSYDANGNLIQIDAYEDGDFFFGVTITYGKYGPTQMTLRAIGLGDGTFEYSYDTNGKLVKLEAKSYYDGVLDSIHTYTFTDHQLCYSENPAVLDRISIVYYTDIGAASEIIW